MPRVSSLSILKGYLSPGSFSAAFAVWDHHFDSAHYLVVIECVDVEVGGELLPCLVVGLWWSQSAKFFSVLCGFYFCAAVSGHFFVPGVCAFFSP